MSASDTISCTREVFWETFFSDEFTRIWFTEGVGATSFRFVDCHGSPAAGRYFRTTRATKPLDMMPAPVRRLFGDEVEVEECGTFKDELWTFKVTPSLLAEKVTATGRVSLEKDDGRSVTARCDLRGELRIFGIGPLVEKVAVPEVRRLVRRSIACMKSYIGEGQLV